MTHQQLGGFGGAVAGLGAGQAGVWAPSRPTAGLLDEFDEEASSSGDDSSYTGGFGGGGGASASARSFSGRWGGGGGDSDEGMFD